MVILKWRLTGGFWVEDQSGNKLAGVKRRFFDRKYLIKTQRGDIIGYTDIYAHKPQNPDETTLENTEYVLVSPLNKNRIAVGFPNRDEKVGGSVFKPLYMKPPLADRIAIHIQGVAEEFSLRLQMNGGATISGAGKDICGHIQHLRIGDFSVDLRNFDDPVLLCGVFLFSRYLLDENKPYNVV